MNITTEQLLGTLEVLTNSSSKVPTYSSRTFLWETSIHGKFDLWNLMKIEGFIKLTDLELVFSHWQDIEEWGTPTNQTKYGEYAPPRSEREDKNWNETIAHKRKGYYQRLQTFISNNLQNIQAYNLCIPQEVHQSFGWQHPRFSVSIIVGEITSKQWLCLAPTIPDEVRGHRRKNNQFITQSISEENKCENKCEITQNMVAKIKVLLDKLNPIEIYGYYYGGYNYSYQHHIVDAVAASKTTAIELALSKAKMIFQEKTNVEYAGSGRKLSQFMNQFLRDRTQYSISFWDIGYFYEVGQTPDGDWIGTRGQSEFDYNP
jgi:hypothetical protein